MFYIAHGSTKVEDNVEYVFNARKWTWICIDDIKSMINMKEQDQFWFNSSLHPNGLFKCPRCYNKHNIVDNFDLLCDGCCKTIQEFHSDHLYFSFSDQFNDWGTNIPTDIIDARIALRSTLDTCYKADILYHKSRPVVIVRDPLKNNGDLEVAYADTDINDKNNRFILNVSEIFYENCT